MSLIIPENPDMPALAPEIGNMWRHVVSVDVEVLVTHSTTYTRTPTDDGFGPYPTLTDSAIYSADFTFNQNVRDLTLATTPGNTFQSIVSNVLQHSLGAKFFVGKDATLGSVGDFDISLEALEYVTPPGTPGDPVHVVNSTESGSMKFTEFFSVLGKRLTDVEVEADYPAEIGLRADRKALWVCSTGITFDSTLAPPTLFGAGDPALQPQIGDWKNLPEGVSVVLTFNNDWTQPDTSEWPDGEIVRLETITITLTTNI